MEQDLEGLERKDLVFSIGYALWQVDRKKVYIDVCRERAERVLGHLEEGEGMQVWRPLPSRF